MSVPITPDFALPDAEIEWTAVRAQGAGGQNVNKTSTAVHLRFDIPASSLPAPWRERLLARRDSRISRDGVLVIKAQATRSQEQNRAQALARLVELLRSTALAPRARQATKPTRASKRRRLEDKVRRGRVKALRGSVAD